MRLKAYQIRCLQAIQNYLIQLSQARLECDRSPNHAAAQSNFPEHAWFQLPHVAANLPYARQYVSRRNGLGDPLPNFCLKIPTGGGKTVLATHTIGLINTFYRKQQHGLVVWVVPTAQIYRQTLNALRNREHPYRQVLDLNSAGRTLVLQRGDRFTPDDISNNLVILIIMLPAANRQCKETLKIFQDSSQFDCFFPPDFELPHHQQLLQQFPNLDCFDSSCAFLPQVKTSLGNTLRILRPVMILDEGHKAYSQSAQETLLNLNPSILVELSATPPGNSNVLISVSGLELKQEEMIKLAIHLVHPASSDWKDVLRAAVQHRILLQQKALQYQTKTGSYIRPICLIQVERTGKSLEQDSRYIHAEDARAFLIDEYGVYPHQIAVKSSERDDIENLDLFDPTCQICYIITKQALQEGWDCSFAYVLAVLTNSTSTRATTQLIGRILRQPYGCKTGMPELDESYVFCYRQNTQAIAHQIKTELETEGLADCSNDAIQIHTNEDSYFIRSSSSVQQLTETVYCPYFLIQTADGWHPLNADLDLVCRLDWDTCYFTDKKHKTLNQEAMAVLDQTPYPDHQTKNSAAAIVDYGFIVRQLLDIIPNPWVAYSVVKDALSALSSTQTYTAEINPSYPVATIEKLRHVLKNERDRALQAMFKDRLDKHQVEFGLVAVSQTDHRAQPGSAKAVYFPEQYQLLNWYRDIMHAPFCIQGREHGNPCSEAVATYPPNPSCKNEWVYVLDWADRELPLQTLRSPHCNGIHKHGSTKHMKWSELAQSFPNQRIVFSPVFDNALKHQLDKIVLPS
ncbi:DEAD/DEAH box helicase family protein [Oculatella sp. LEGE 06141]|uniref:DEAD/DEAH box helicase n=1 Tax=Oculatella sp. LEGE 06141 TaxID=1828648 RepID=UPI00187E0D42|nr:DEAD/DEAH box helicase family protein [Oculatella sp. LEGE 06141]MBE9181730.1 DEAD/DEAH box helicase family protein [Oculatella sp. LEGE 06141]